MQDFWITALSRGPGRYFISVLLSAV